MKPGDDRISGQWLTLREPADAAARSPELVERLARELPAGPRVIHDLGGGTGSMGRWLAPLLTGPQHWVVHDRDAELLAATASRSLGPGADGSAVTVETRDSDITRLPPDELAGATLITASALLDLLTAEELARLVVSCTAAGCPALLTLSVVGRIELDPAEPLDARVTGAFNDHQRRATGRGPLLGPDAVAAAAEAFGSQGAEVLVRPSPWRLGAAEAPLATEWLTGWLGAACEQEPGLTAEAGAYADRRRAQAGAGQLAVSVHHADLLALPGSAPSVR